MLWDKTKYRFNNLKIHTKLSFILGFVIIISLIITYIFSFSIASKIVNEQIDNNVKSSVQQIRYNLDMILSDMRSNAEQIYQDKVTKNFLLNADLYTGQQYFDLVMPMLTKGNIASTYLSDYDGRSYGYNISYANINLDYKNTEEYKKIKQSNDKFIWVSTNHISIESKFLPESLKNQFALATTIKDFNTMKEIGFLLMTFRENDIFNVYNKIKITEGTYGFIVDSEGNIVSNGDKSLLGTKSVLYLNFKERMNQVGSGSFTFTNNNKDYLLMYDTLETNNWRLIYIVPKQDLLKNINLIRNMFLIIMIVCLIVSMSLAFFISRSISKPIEDIISVMYKFGKGDLSVRISKYNDRTDEVGVLADKFNGMIKQIKYLINTNYRNEIKKKEAELQALQAQINPHFLYNTLDCINFMARKYKVYEISNMVIALGDLMRISIKKDLNIITVKDEISYIQNYMTIQKIRYKEKFELQINIDDDIFNVNIPKLILQPLIENAVVHGIEAKIGNGTIIINGYKNENDIIFEIKDDGVGFDITSAKKMLNNNLSEYENMNNDVLDGEQLEKEYKGEGSNIGLHNVDMRLKLMYGKEYGLSIKSKIGEGTEIFMKLPQNVELRTKK